MNQITFKHNGTTRMTTTKQYDYLNRLTQISSIGGASSARPISFNYTYNPANQRTKDTLVDGSYWVYQYDSLGQVTSGKKYWPDGTPVAGQQFGYAFDDIGNRTQTQNGGDQTGGNLRTANYSANNLNQITSRDYPGTNDIVGVALATNSVTVNGQLAYRHGEYFWATVQTNNTAAPQWQDVTVASGGATNKGGMYVPQTPEQFHYDADGNLTNDGRWSYVWDAENRLVQMTVNTNVGPQYQLTFVYDSVGRRIEKIVAENGVPVSTRRFLYDGWNLIASLNPQSSMLKSFVWGTDLSGSVQGAGGVGGLLEVSDYEGGTTHCFPAFDGNGNVMALVNANDGTTVANYEYGPFGETIRMTGTMADNNPFRFSTKYQDDESDLLYYGYRFYDPSTGRWLNRDRIEEGGGPDLYCAFDNDAINQFDVYGMWATAQHHALIGTWLQNNPPPLGETWSHYKWHCIYLDIPALLKQGNDVVDGVGEGFGGFCDAQSSANSYMHSMRAWYESKAVARAKRDAFVRARESLAEWYSNAAGKDASGGCCGNAVQTYMDDAIIMLGEAQHPLADDTSPPHHGFQRWFGISDGIAILGPVGYAIFVERHHWRERPAVYASKGDGPANTVAAQMQPELLKIMAQ